MLTDLGIHEHDIEKAPIHIYIYIYIHCISSKQIDHTKFRTSDEQSTSAKRSEANKRLNKVPLQRNAHFWQAPADFEQGRRTSGRTRLKKSMLVEEKSITNKVVEQGSNKGVEQGVEEQGRTSDGRTKCRTRSNKDVEQGRTRSNKDFFR